MPVTFVNTELLMSLDADGETPGCSTLGRSPTINQTEDNKEKLKRAEFTDHLVGTLETN